MGNNEENLVESRYSTTLLSGVRLRGKTLRSGFATDISTLLFYSVVRDGKRQDWRGGAVGGKDGLRRAEEEGIKHCNYAMGLVF